MKSPIVRWLIALNILVLSSVLFALFNQRHHQHQAQQAFRTRADRMAQAAWKSDDATSDERARLHIISESVQRRQALTDDQISLLLTEISKPNARGVANVSHLTAMMCLDAMRTPLSSSQRSLLYTRLVPLLAIPDPTVSSGITLTQMHKMEACDMLAHFGVREAIPQIVPLLNDPKQQVQVVAKRALKNLEHST